MEDLIACPTKCVFPKAARALVGKDLVQVWDQTQMMGFPLITLKVQSV